MKKTYEVDVDQVKENIILEIGRYVSCNGGYSRELLDHNLKQILEKGYKEVPTDYKG
ncbi:hypothetical protein [Niameybacter massiliensis]|uniref:hypothetical protein n=1 Tax=Niameybacter massiliensis TaxID=1658108 RepID=UPI0012B586E8|nr:hypothetical protein [Niameybacter massiliensis]